MGSVSKTKKNSLHSPAAAQDRFHACVTAKCLVYYCFCVLFCFLLNEIFINKIKKLIFVVVFV